MKATNNKSHSRIFKNALFLYALTFSNYLIGLLLLPYLSRSAQRGEVRRDRIRDVVLPGLNGGGGVRLPAVDHRDHLRASRRQGKNVPNHLDDDVHQAAAGVRSFGRVPGIRDVRGHAPRPFRDHPAVLRGLDSQGAASGRLLQGHRTHEGHYHPRGVREIRNLGGDADCS